MAGAKGLAHQPVLLHKKTYGNTKFARPNPQVPVPQGHHNSMNSERELYHPTPTKTRPSIQGEAKDAVGGDRGNVNPIQGKIAGGDINPEYRPYLLSPKPVKPGSRHEDEKKGDADSPGVNPEGLGGGDDILDDGRSPLPSWGMRLQKYTYNAMAYVTPTMSEQMRAARAGEDSGQASGQQAQTGDTGESAIPVRPTLHSHPSVPPASTRTPTLYTRTAQPTGMQTSTQRRAGHTDSRDRTAGGAAAEEPQPPGRHPPSFWDPPTDEEIARVPTPDGIRAAFNMKGRSVDQTGKPRPLRYSNAKIMVAEYGPSLAGRRVEYEEYEGMPKGKTWRNFLGREVPKTPPTPPWRAHDEHASRASIPSKATLTPSNAPDGDSDSFNRTGTYSRPSVPSKATLTPTYPIPFSSQTEKGTAAQTEHTGSGSMTLPPTDQSGFQQLHISQPVSQKTVKGVKDTTFPWFSSMQYEKVVPLSADKLREKSSPRPENYTVAGVQPRMIIEDELRKPFKPAPNEPPEPSLDLNVTGKHFIDTRKGKYWNQENLTPEAYDLREERRKWVPGHKHFHMGVDANSMRYGGSQMSVWQGDTVRGYHGDTISNSQPGTGAASRATIDSSTQQPQAGVQNTPGHTQPNTRATRRGVQMGHNRTSTQGRGSQGQQGPGSRAPTTSAQFLEVPPTRHNGAGGQPGEVGQRRETYYSPTGNSPTTRGSRNNGGGGGTDSAAAGSWDHAPAGGASRTGPDSNNKRLDSWEGTSVAQLRSGNTGDNEPGPNTMGSYRGTPLPSGTPVQRPGNAGMGHDRRHQAPVAAQGL